MKEDLNRLVLTSGSGHWVVLRMSKLITRVALQVQYNQRLEDIRVLKLEIKKLRREKAILQKSVANVDDLR